MKRLLLVRQMPAVVSNGPNWVRSRPETGVDGAGHRFCFATYQVIEERTYARACTSIPGPTVFVPGLPLVVRHGDSACGVTPLRRSSGPYRRLGRITAR